VTDAQFILSVLEDGQKHSQADLLRRSFEERGCGLTVHSRIADLRKDHVIVCERVPGASRGHAWVYQLVGSLPTSPQSSPEPALAHGHAQPIDGSGRGDVESESLFEITDYGMGGKPAWA
jgi:hypothetical protein